MPTPFQSATPSAVTITAGGSYIDVLTLKCNGQLDQAAITVSNTGSNPTTGSQISAQYADGGPFLPWIRDNGMTIQFGDTFPQGPPIYAIPPGQSAAFRFAPGPVVAVKLQIASTAGTSVTATIGRRANGGATEAPRQGIEI